MKAEIKDIQKKLTFLEKEEKGMFDVLGEIVNIDEITYIKAICFNKAYEKILENKIRRKKKFDNIISNSNKKWINMPTYADKAYCLKGITIYLDEGNRKNLNLLNLLRNGNGDTRIVEYKKPDNIINLTNENIPFYVMQLLGKGF